MTLPLALCAVFYSVLCVFSIVTGLMYARGKRKLNPLELSEKIMSRLSDADKLKRFTVRMGWVTFVVGLVQGLAAFALFRRGSGLLYGIALGFTVFSVVSVLFKLKGKISLFPLLKLAAYLAILLVLLLPGARSAFFG
ncbi:MAG: hypothetical protein IJH48_04480 [Oscillospiraceae bacterium]|nr:hypothetical protein [Oscillospiraceae bacterium]